MDRVHDVVAGAEEGGRDRVVGVVEDLVRLSGHHPPVGARARGAEQGPRVVVAAGLQAGKRSPRAAPRPRPREAVRREPDGPRVRRRRAALRGETRRSGAGAVGGRGAGGHARAEGPTLKPP